MAMLWCRQSPWQLPLPWPLPVGFFLCLLSVCRELALTTSCTHAAHAGSTAGSDTHKQMRSALRHHLLGSEADVHEWFRKVIPGLRGADPKVEVVIANSLWAGGDVKGEFSEVCKEVFLSDVYPLGPGAASQINSWVSEKTKGKIQKLLESDPKGPAVLLNAVYFKGEWSSTFDDRLTQEGNTSSIWRPWSPIPKYCAPLPAHATMESLNAACQRTFEWVLGFRV
jgi:hypothetical protein